MTGEGRGVRRRRASPTCPFLSHHPQVLYRIFTVDHKLLPVGRTVIISIEVPVTQGLKHARVKDLGRDREINRERDIRKGTAAETQRQRNIEAEPQREAWRWVGTQKDSIERYLRPWVPAPNKPLVSVTLDRSLTFLRLSFLIQRLS